MNFQTTKGNRERNLILFAVTSEIQGDKEIEKEYFELCRKELISKHQNMIRISE